MIRLVMVLTGFLALFVGALVILAYAGFLMLGHHWALGLPLATVGFYILVNIDGFADEITR